MSRPVLLAMNNPISSRPEHALYPYPPGCTGWRVHRMLEDSLGEPVSRRQYLEAFDRRNLLSSKEWSQREARAAGERMRPELAGRTVVVFGASTWEALGLDRRPPWGHWADYYSGDLLDPSRRFVTICPLPHPSGRCREYNDPLMTALAGSTLAALYRTADRALA